MSPAAPPLLHPVAVDERINSLDVLRGFALLGILLMNILDFGLPNPAYSNLRLWGGDQGVNVWVFAAQYILAEGKMRALFSMMFGASIILLTERGVARGGGIEVADLYFRRMLWLMAFGIAHAYLIWYGDILFPYSICGLLLFAVRHWPPLRLLNIVFVLIIGITAGAVHQGFDRIEKKQKAEAAIRIDKAGGKLTDEQKKSKEDWEEALKRHEPPRAELQKEVDNYRASYAKALAERAKKVTEWHSGPIYNPGLADMWMMMMLGMALLRLGVLQAARSEAFFVKMAVAGYGIGLPLNAWSVWTWVRSNYNILQEDFSFAPYHVGRVAVALAHLAVLMLIIKRGWLAWLTRRLAAVGQMALSNYLAQSIICSFVFYSHGFALIGQLQRYQLYYVVFGVWLFNLIWSPIWLRHYRFGPAEWAWRSLTYWERQPMRLVAAEPVSLPDR